MRTCRPLVLAALFAGLFASPAAAQGDRPYKAAWFCNSRPDVSPVYVSGVWEKSEIQDEITLEFRKFVESKYGYKGIVMCGGAGSTQNTNALVVEEKSKAGQIAAWQKAGMTIVETGWNGDQPKVGPAPVHWSVCAAGVAIGGRPRQTQFETYVTAPFDAGDASQQVQEAAFEKYLRSTYSIQTTDLHPQCVAVEDEAKALSAIKQWTTNGNARGRTINTGWKMGK
jgi:hypothetical protein